MTLAVLPYPGANYNEMFRQYSVYAHGAETPSYIWRQCLINKGVEVISLDELRARGGKADALLHVGPYRADLIREFPHLKHVYFAVEEPTVHPCNRAKSLEIMAKFVYDAIVANNFAAKGANIFELFYPRRYCEATPPPEYEEIKKKKLACMLAGNKYGYGKIELYSERRKVIRYCEAHAREDFDLYGAGWPEELAVYRGFSEDKWATLQNYRFNICFENTTHVKCFVSEKIFDAMAAGTVPVYWGVDDIDKWIPAGCYVDYRQFSSPAECMDYLREMDAQTYREYLNNMYAFMTSPQTWEKYSGEHLAEQLLLACSVPPKSSKRHLWILDLLKLESRLYGKLCRMQELREEKTLKKC